MLAEPTAPPVVPPAPAQTPPPPVELPKTFTQEELDRIIKERLGREQARFADYDTLKEAAEELSKLKEADLSEQELLKKRIAEMQEAATAREAQAEANAAEVNQRLIRSEVRVLAATMDFWEPKEAYKLADLTGATVDENGEVQGIKQPLKDLAENSKHLIKAAGGPGSPPNKPSKTVTKDVELEEAVTDARERFNIKDYSKQPGGKD